MLIVVEGCDRTGKTELCDLLANQHGGEVMHWGAPSESNAIAEYVDPLLDYVPGRGQNLFVDRHYLGELVWPQFFGRESLLSWADQVCIELFLKSRGAYCVRTWREPTDLERACREENEPIVGRAAEAQDLFIARAAASSLRWQTYVHGSSLQPILLGAQDLEQTATRDLPAAFR